MGWHARSHLVPRRPPALGRAVPTLPTLGAPPRALAPVVAGAGALALAALLRKAQLIPRLRGAHHRPAQLSPLLPAGAALTRGEMRPPLRVAPQAEAAEVGVLALRQHLGDEHQRVGHFQQLAQRALQCRRSAVSCGHTSWQGDRASAHLDRRNGDGCHAPHSLGHSRQRERQLPLPLLPQLLLRVVDGRLQLRRLRLPAATLRVS